jgi:hypothetical protein
MAEQPEGEVSTAAKEPCAGNVTDATGTSAVAEEGADVPTAADANDAAGAVAAETTQQNLPSPPSPVPLGATPPQQAPSGRKRGRQTVRRDWNFHRMSKVLTL